MKRNPRISHSIMGALMLSIGLILMLIPVVAAHRLHATDPRLITGFITACTGAMLLTKTSIAVFFYFLYVISFLVFQMRHHGFFSLGVLGMTALLVVGFYLIKVLKRRQ